MGSQSSKEVTIQHYIHSNKEEVTPQYIENCKNEVNNWHIFTEKTVKNVFEDSLSHTGMNESDRDGLLKRSSGILCRLRGFITSGFGTFFDTIVGCCLEKTPGDMMDAQFRELYKDFKDFEKTTRDVKAKLGEKPGNLFSIVVATIVGFLRGIMNWIKWLFQKIGEFVENCVDFVTNAIRSLFEKTGDLENHVRTVVIPSSVLI